MSDLSQSASVRFRRFAVNPDGSEIMLGDWQPNLLLNIGLDGLYSSHWVDNFAYGVLGTSTNPTRRDSSPVTFTVTGGTITASAGFFVAGDVGRLLKTNDGGATEMTITGFTSSTVVTTSSAATIGTAVTGTVWYVNDTSLGAEVKRTNTYTTSTGDNGSSFAVDTWTHQRTYIFSAETGTITYHEIGWAFANTGSLFGRALIAGAGDTLIAGQQYKVVIQLSIKYSPATPTAVGDVSGGAFNTAGTASIEKYSETYNVDVNGNPVINGNGMLEMQATGRVAAIVKATWTQGGMTSPGPALSVPDSVALTAASYVTGSFQKILSGTFSVNVGNYSNFGVCIPGSGNIAAFSVKYTTPVTKDNLHTLTPTFTYSWGRILTN